MLSKSISSQTRRAYHALLGAAVYLDNMIGYSVMGCIIFVFLLDNMIGYSVMGCIIFVFLLGNTKRNTKIIQPITE
jgi:hypothetical protein